jgi:hypothetical protein
MVLEYQRFTIILLLIYGSLFLSGVYFPIFNEVPRYEDVLENGD